MRLWSCVDSSGLSGNETAVWPEAAFGKRIVNVEVRRIARILLGGLVLIVIDSARVH